MSALKFHILGLLWVKFAVDLQMVLLRSYENRCSERHSLLKGVNRIFLYFLHLISSLDVIH